MLRGETLAGDGGGRQEETRAELEKMGEKVMSAGLGLERIRDDESPTMVAEVGRWWTTR